MRWTAFILFLLAFASVPGWTTSAVPRPGRGRVHASTQAPPQRHAAAGSASGKNSASKKHARPSADYSAGYREGFAAAQAEAARQQRGAVCKGTPAAQPDHPANTSQKPASASKSTSAKNPAPTKNQAAAKNSVPAKTADAAKIPAPDKAPAKTSAPARTDGSHGAALPHAAYAATPAPLRPSKSNPFEEQVAQVSVVNASTLRGTFESLSRQNERLEADGLERIEDDDDLEDRIDHKMLVPLPASAALAINGDLPPLRRYCRPWTAQFLADLAGAHQKSFRKALLVSSAVRTVAYQKRLIGTNGNAAAAEGDIVSPHLTGAAVDIPKDGMSRKELAWMRAHLLILQQAGKIDVEEEFQQPCFHIAVYKSYLQPAPRVRMNAKPAEAEASNASETPHGE